MDLESLRAFCLSLPAVTEDVKWEHDLCFSIGGKMFCVASLEAPLSFSFKVNPEDFQELSVKPGLTPAPYLARYHWILASEGHPLSKAEVETRVRDSYEMIKSKLPKKALKEAGLL
ncbi:MmcQ/YjbR family DNA-binding protein [Nibribacter koreensis]|uniref:MmcQ/YjbR family DNA-binding protein n=1 Tax=Nibribacter koreensis TaxID=1084519 RepID=A0ABP8FAV3_9BACT